jgi:hypothetical protein
MEGKGQKVPADWRQHCRKGAKKKKSKKKK